ncbi:Ceramide synthase 4 [Conglomerata obtusa]
MNKKWESRSIESNFDLKYDIPGITLAIIAYYLFRYMIAEKITNALITRRNIRQEERKKLRVKLFGSIYRACVYGFMATYGFFVLKNENWVFDIFEYTLTWENNRLPTNVRIYYYIEIGHYLSTVIFTFTEPRLADFYQMIVHHIITLLLLFFSYYTNLLRYGIIIMFIHDVADPLMECAKIFLYLRYQKSADALFCAFAFVFIFTRCIIYPLSVVFPGIYYGYKFGLTTYFILQICALVMLLLLNVIWSMFISKMVINFIRSGKVKGDIRSEDYNDTRKKNK